LRDLLNHDVRVLRLATASASRRPQLPPAVNQLQFVAVL
jgi:hypothetical protein